ncbi:helix-turn-helix domain-containing protein [uncultured Roseibium sp.]|uniref:helix-turn-helix domain-containing protein n=1 Tax=uncultured Roseibium sp. TaxID=1936171 RepID=UPI0037491313
MDTLGDRIRKAADEIGGLDSLAQLANVKRRTIYDYASNKTEPKISTLVEISRVTGVSVEWLAVGSGIKQARVEIVDVPTSMTDVRKYVWNIAATFWEKLPRRTKPDQAADQFVEMLDYLVSRKDVGDDAASEVIQFAAERLKRTSSQDGS